MCFGVIWKASQEGSRASLKEYLTVGGLLAFEVSLSEPSVA